MRHPEDPTPIEDQIATLMLGVEVFDQAHMDAAIKQQFPEATEAEIAKAADIAIDILNAAADAFEAEGEAYSAALDKRDSNGTA